ncbi:MAG: hypothetical protein IJR13_10390 [Bacteroidales bacterium]|nr:hypothetical protein [Bacteroidales bacterium]
MSDNHKHRHHHDDYSSRYKRYNLRRITLRRKLEGWLKVLLLIVALGMIAAVVYLYCQ